MDRSHVDGTIIGMRRSSVVTALVLAVLASGCRNDGGGGVVATVSPSTTSPSTTAEPAVSSTTATYEVATLEAR
jgi:hypothetical protein